MVRPLIGESFAECRAYYLHSIDQCREFISVLSKIKSPPENYRLAQEIIARERKEITDTWQTLKQLQRWFKQQDLAEDEPFMPVREGKNEQKNRVLEETPST